MINIKSSTHKEDEFTKNQATAIWPGTFEFGKTSIYVFIVDDKMLFNLC